MKIIFLSETADKAFIEYMSTKGTVILIPRDERFDERIGSHPDLVIAIIDGTIIIDKDAHRFIYQQLDALGVPYVIGNSRLSRSYPQDIANNAVITKDFLIHNLKYTDPLLLLHSKYSKKRLIHVKQGYTKCSTVVVNDNSIITGDQGIYEAVKESMNALFVSPGHVLLEGYDNGFLGGASACFEDSVVFYGDISKHPDFTAIKAFIQAAQKELIYFEDIALTDIGSILVYDYHKSRNLGQTNEQKHVNIPIFISHEGCPNDCVFCNQRKITAKVEAMTLQEVTEQIDNYSSTLNDRTYTELAFFGGSFTGIAAELQESYLKLAYENKRSGRIQAIRLSTRPDYISEEILDRLKRYEVDTIELGVQSFDEEVLEASNRGHSVEDIYQAVKLIKEYGFKLGLQLMVGLPRDTREKAVCSAKQAALLNPEFIRIYPTLVIRETQLSEMTNQGIYSPLSLETAVEWTKEMYQVFMRKQIPVIRIGLQPTDLIAEGKEVLYGPFHPAFRQLVESSYFMDEIKRMLPEHKNIRNDDFLIKIMCNPKDLSQVIGHKRRNLIELKKDYPNIQVISDQGMKPMTIKCFQE